MVHTYILDKTTYTVLANRIHNAEKYKLAPLPALLLAPQLLVAPHPATDSTHLPTVSTFTHATVSIC